MKNGMQLFSMVNFAYTLINWLGGEIIWKMQIIREMTIPKEGV